MAGAIGKYTLYMLDLNCSILPSLTLYRLQPEFPLPRAEDMNNAAIVLQLCYVLFPNEFPIIMDKYSETYVGAKKVLKFSQDGFHI